MTLTPETLEWIKKAEGDFKVASRELAVVVDPVYDSVCFHVQQCVEKYLKALLSNKRQVAPRVHDLEQLLYRVVPYYPQLEQQFDEAAWEMLAEISSGAVEVCYPGATTTADDAKRFYTSGRMLRDWFRQTLGLQS